MGLDYDPSKDEVIIEFKNSLKNKKLSGLCLDIDETLSYTAEYWYGELVKIFGSPDDMSVEELFKKYRRSQDVPLWQTPEALEWMQKANMDIAMYEYNHRIIPDSSNELKFINQHIVGYLTVRPRLSIDATNKWLSNNDFPNLEIIAKPDEIALEVATEWKARALEFLYPEIQGIVDDSHGLVNLLSERYEGVVFTYNSNESVRNDIKNIACRDWKQVTENVKGYFSK